MTDAGELLAVAKRAAAAGAAVLAQRSATGTGGDGLETSNKGEAGDWVTAFDVAAENAVREAIITERPPHDTITGEEHGTTRPEQPSGYRWSIDPPLDGTTNFIRNIVYYATSVAVADSDGVWQPAWFTRRRGAHLFRGPRTWRVDGSRGRGDAPGGSGSRAHRPHPGHRLQLRSRYPGKPI